VTWAGLPPNENRECQPSGWETNPTRTMLRGWPEKRVGLCDETSACPPPVNCSSVSRRRSYGNARHESFVDTFVSSQLRFTWITNTWSSTILPVSAVRPRRHPCVANRLLLAPFRKSILLVETVVAVFRCRLAVVVIPNLACFALSVPLPHLALRNVRAFFHALIQ